jgi:hypothetical protein
MDWQPAIVIDGHPEWGPPLNEDWPKLIGKRVRMMLLPEGHVAESTYRKFGCTARLFLIHVDDARSCGIPGSSETTRFVVCEHEILTD